MALYLNLASDTSQTAESAGRRHLELFVAGTTAQRFAKSSSDKTTQDLYVSSLPDSENESWFYFQTKNLQETKIQTQEAGYETYMPQNLCIGTHKSCRELSVAIRYLSHEDGYSTFLQNAGIYAQVHTALPPRSPTSHAFPWK